MSEIKHTPLTLTRWAALDAAACKGSWFFEKHGNAYWLLGEFITAAQDHVYLGEIGGTFDSEGEKNAAFIAASRQAPTRLLAALRGLAAEWESEQDWQDLKNPHETCAAQLRALIEQTDLSEDAQ